MILRVCLTQALDMNAVIQCAQMLTKSSTIKITLKTRFKASVTWPNRVVDPFPRVIWLPYCDSKMLTRKFCSTFGYC